jgi:hypothetical protein
MLNCYVPLYVNARARYMIGNTELNRRAYLDKLHLATSYICRTTCSLTITELVEMLSLSAYASTGVYNRNPHRQPNTIAPYIIVLLQVPLLQLPRTVARVAEGTSFHGVP